MLYKYTTLFLLRNDKEKVHIYNVLEAKNIITECKDHKDVTLL